MKFFAPFQLSENIHKTPEGYLLCKDVCIGRTGDMIYGAGEVPIQPGPDGKVIITRSADELFRTETIASFEGKPLTILHPEDFVDPKNWTMLTKGIVQNVRRGTGAQESDLVADLLVTDDAAIELVKNGLREVSCGYEAEYTETGVGRGVQTDIVGNHLALVEEGRAGSKYAINDHKGKGSMKTISEKIKAIFSDAQDKALKAATEDAGGEATPGKKEGFVSMDEVKSYFDEKFEAMGKKKDEPAKDAGTEQNPQTGAPAEVKAKDEGEEVPAWAKKLMERLDALEAKGAAVGDEDEEGEEEETGDEEEEVEVDDESAEEEEGATGDAARVEILAPGMKAEGKNLRVKALLAAYATKDGKEAIHLFTGNKPIDAKASAQTVDALFIGVSEVLKSKRSGDLAGARSRVRDEFLSTLDTPKGAKSADEINEINANHYGKK